jgi:hypothetical protein
VTPALLKPGIIQDEHAIAFTGQHLHAGDALAVERVLIQTMSVSKCLNCCSLVSGTTSAKVSQFLLGCSLSKPVRCCRRVSALGPWVKCTRSGAKNSASSGRGARGVCGNRARFWALRLIRLGYYRFTDSDKVVLILSAGLMVNAISRAYQHRAYKDLRDQYRLLGRIWVHRTERQRAPHPYSGCELVDLAIGRIGFTLGHQLHNVGCVGCRTTILEAIYVSPDVLC